MTTGVFFISGKPGGGKSMYATMRVIDTIRFTRKRVVTNLPLVLPRLREYLIEKYGSDFDCLARIRILKPEETATFWRFYGQAGCELPDYPRHELKLASGKVISHLDYGPRFLAMIAARMKTGEGVPVYEVGEGMDSKIAQVLWQKLNETWDGGIHYIIDEAHEFFNARAWAETGVDALHYLSQHRKLGDMVDFVTQHVRNVDTQLRRVAQSFSYVKNMRKMKLPILGGLVRAPAIFLVTTYPEEKTGQSGGGDPELKPFTLDVKGIASCYETAAGVGIQGAGADKGEKLRGLPWWCLPLIFALGFTGCIGVYKGAKYKALAMVEDKVPAKNTNAPAVPVSWRSPIVTNTVPNQPPPSRVKITGHVMDPKGGFRVFLSDGRELVEGVKFVGRGQIEYKGERFSF